MTQTVGGAVDVGGSDERCGPRGRRCRLRRGRTLWSAAIDRRPAVIALLQLGRCRRRGACRRESGLRSRCAAVRTGVR